MPAASTLVKRLALILLALLSFFYLLSNHTSLHTSTPKTSPEMPSKFNYTAVTGHFRHDSEPIGPPFESVTQPGLGLINQPYESDKTLTPGRDYSSWERFTHFLEYLNEKEAGKASYKLIYAARHGQGYHNVKEKEVGVKAWEGYWARLDGDDKMTWSDAHLTETGIQQARDMNNFWRESSSVLKLPLPTRHYSSPMARCLETCEMAWAGISLPSESTADSNLPVPMPFTPVIKELIRERLGIHTCDRRRSKTWIQDNHPLFTFEEGFKERDELWVPDVRETIEQHGVRVKGFLDDLFENDKENQIVSVTGHSGTIQALYLVTGHPEVRVAPGAVVPVMIRAEVVDV